MTTDHLGSPRQRNLARLARGTAAAASLGGVLVALLWVFPAGGASTGTSSLYVPQGQDSPTNNGDFITSDDATGDNGLNTFYSYFVEVPSGLSRLVVELFDADNCNSCPAEQDAQRDRFRDTVGLVGDAANVFDYSLLDPSGVVQAMETSEAVSNQPGSADNVWLALLDTNFPAFAGVATAATGDVSVTSLTVARPAGTSSGDLLIFAVTTDGGDAINTPTGGGTWTLVNEGACAGSACRLGVWQRIAGGSEPATYNVTWTGGGEEAVGAILRYTGVDSASPIVVSGAGTGTSAAPTAPSVTTGAVTNTRIVRLYGADDLDISATPYPGSHSGRFNLRSSATGGSATGGGADAMQAAAGATGTAAFALAASEEWRAVTLAVRPDGGGSPANGHWELRVNTSDGPDEDGDGTLDQEGDDLNALGIRAHDGTSGSGGTEIPIYYHSHNQFGVNPDQDENVTLIKNYDAFPWITSGCTFFHDDFDYDSNQANNIGNVSYTSRSTAFTQLFDNNTLATNDVWQRDTIPRWTTDSLATDYGIWRMDVQIRTYDDGASGNYANIYVGNFNASNPAAATDDGIPSQPESNTFRVYLPTDASDTTAPVKPYLEQLLTYLSGPNPPLVGQATRVEVTVRLVNPTAHSITFSSPSNVVTANVPGSGAVYAGNPVMSQGSLVSQPSIGGTGNVVWNPGTVTAGSTEILAYQVDVTPTSAGQRVVVTGTPAANGTQAQYVDETGNTTQSRATYLFGPICELAATQGILTHALLARFEAYVEGGRRIVAWETSSEAGTLGFRLYRAESGERRWVKLHDGLLPAAVAAPAGAFYRFADDSALPGGLARYLLVEIDLRGQGRTFGPFTVGLGGEGRPAESLPELEGAFDAVARPTPDALAERLALHREEERRSLAVKNSVPATALKVLVRQSGLHYLSAQSLATYFGVGPANVRTWIGNGRLRLTRGGRQVAWLSAAGNAGLYFYGQPLGSPFSLDTVYRLERRTGLPMASVGLGDPDPVDGELTFLADLHLEQEVFAATVLPLDPRGDFWFWEGILAGHPTLGTKSFTVTAPEAVTTAQAATLTVYLQGASDSGVPGEHVARVRLNGAFLGEATWQGLDAHAAAFPFASALLAAGDNTVEVEGVLGPGVGTSAFYVDSFDLSYPRRYRAAADALLVRGDGNQVVTVDGFASPDVRVFDLTDPTRPRVGTGVRLNGAAGDFRASFEPATPATPYLAVSAAGALAPAALVPDAPSALRSPGNRAQYLVIAPAELVPAAEALADLRRSQGLETQVADLADVYDEFNFGQPDPLALADFLRYAAGSWQGPLAYVVLAGDGSSDYRDLLGFGGNLVPPVLVATPSGLFAADNAYGDLAGDDGVPELAVGRIPVLTAQELLDYAAKLTAFETSRGPASDTFVFVADNVDQGADFGAQAEGLAQPLGAYRVVQLELGPLPLAALRQELFAEAAAGTGLVAYLGHGGPLGLADEGILTLADGGALSAAEPPLVLAALTCGSNRFELPGYTALSEELLAQPQGGAAAVWAPSGLAHHPEAEALGRELLETLGADPTLPLGDAVRAALAAYAATGNTPELTAIYNLLGDPALRLRLAPTPIPPEPPGGTSSGE